MSPILNGSIDNNANVDGKSKKNETNEGVSHLEAHHWISDQTVPSSQVIHEDHETHLIGDFNIGSHCILMWAHSNVGDEIHGVKKHEDDDLHQWLSEHHWDSNEQNSSESESNGIEFDEFVSIQSSVLVQVLPFSSNFGLLQIVCSVQEEEGGDWGRDQKKSNDNSPVGVSLSPVV